MDETEHSHTTERRNWKELRGAMERFLDAHHFAGKSRFRLNAPLLNGIGEKEDPRYSKSRGAKQPSQERMAESEIAVLK